MGILSSFLFPKQFMFAQQSPSTSPTTTSSSDPDPDPENDLLNISPPPSPRNSPSTAPSTPDRQHPSSPLTQTSFPDSPPLDPLRTYTPHALGIGRSVPRPIFAPLSTLHSKEMLEHSKEVHRQRSQPSMTPEPGPSVVHGNTFSGSEYPLDSQTPTVHLPDALDTPPPKHSSSTPPAPPMPSPPLPHPVSGTSTSMTELSGPPAQSPSTSSPATLSVASPGVFSQRSPSPTAPGLRIAIPPQNPATIFGNAATSSPPPTVPAVPTPHPHALTHSAVSDYLHYPGTAPTDFAQEPLQTSANELNMNLHLNLGLDLPEFDSDGLETLEKIYLFSRSRAGFHRVFIAHALPGYLRSGASPHAHPGAAGVDAQSAGAQGSEPLVPTDAISPQEAVEYVLPLLNGLALDEDETVKEALAAELVPIIWWFITRCRLVEFDDQTAADVPSSPAGAGAEPSTSAAYENGRAAGPTLIPVQAFTPMLGTLLLSSNTMVGGPARYAVVELLRRVRRADRLERGDAPPGMVAEGLDQREETMEEEEEDDMYAPVGLFGRAERRMFEREMVQEVVIGMGRLDLSDDAQPNTTDGEQELFRQEQGITDETPGTMTAMATPMPMPVHGGVGYESGDSYFPTLSAPFVHSSQQEQGQERDRQASTSMDESFSPPWSPSPASSVYSPSASPFLAPSPISSVSSIASGSTPSLVSTATSSSFASSVSPPDLHLTMPPSSADEVGLERKAPGVGEGEEVGMIDVNWVPPSPRPRHATLPVQSQTDGQPATVSMLLSSSEPEPERNLWLGVGEGEACGDSRPVSRGTAAREEAAALSEEASVGRLSSMSLMAAVTASGSIGAETKAAFVAEVDRVGRDPVYWVRREASFAVGALAKVVPVELVISTLLPLFEALCQDTTWQVRHSALFALPAVLSRLAPEKRRHLALDVILPLARDESATVRTGVLESLAEVMYTFHKDARGPPEELLRLFLGIREGGHESEPPPRPSTPPSLKTMTWSEFMALARSGSDFGESSAPTDIYDDPSRPLVCAFNYPAVALTLGQERWPELRMLYLALARNASAKVRRTLAASVGEMAKIVGRDHARQDVVGVWWSSVRAEEGEVRVKAVECLETFLSAVGEEERAEVVGGLEEMWDARLRGWREREGVMKAFERPMELGGVPEEVVRRLLKRGLQDSVAAVRETAVSAISSIVSAWSSRPESLAGLRADIQDMATSSAYRHRMTYVACEQEIVLSAQNGAVLASEEFWQRLIVLAQDSIVDVRIRVARLLGILQDKLSVSSPQFTTRHIQDLAQRLSQDESTEVKAFAESINGIRPIVPPRREPPSITRSASNFSRPPPPSPAG